MEYFSQDDLKRVELLATKVEKTLFDETNGTTKAQKDILSSILLSCNDLINNMKLVNSEKYCKPAPKDVHLPYQYSKK